MIVTVLEKLSACPCSAEDLSSRCKDVVWPRRSSIRFFLHAIYMYTWWSRNLKCQSSSLPQDSPPAARPSCQRISSECSCWLFWACAEWRWHGIFYLQYQLSFLNHVRSCKMTINADFRNLRKTALHTAEELRRSWGNLERKSVAMVGKSTKGFFFAWLGLVASGYEVLLVS